MLVFATLALLCASARSVETVGRCAWDQWVLHKQQDSPAHSAIILFDGFSFALTVPRGWFIDAEGGAADGLAAVIYPEGSSWSKARTVMYVNVVRKEVGETVTDVVRDDIRRFRDGDNRVRVKDGPPINTGPLRSAVVKQFYGVAPKRYEAVAYVDSGRRVAVLVLSAKTRREFQDAMAGFESVVASYFPTSRGD